MFKKIKSLKVKLLVFCLALLTIALIVAWFAVSNLARDYFLDRVGNRLEREIRLVRELLPHLNQDLSTEKLNNLIVNYGDKLGVRLTVVGHQGQFLADSKTADPKSVKLDNYRHRPEIQAALKDKVGNEIRYNNALGQNIYYLALPVRTKGEISGVIRAAISIEALKELYFGFGRRLFQLGSLLFLLVSLVSVKFATRITAPLARMTKAAKQIAAGSFDQELIVRTNDEIGRLAKIFNHMVVKIRSKINQISNEKSKVEAIVSSIADGIIAVDQKKEVILINRAAETMFGVEKEDVLTTASIQVIRNHRLDELITQALQTAEHLTEEIELLLPEEKIFRVSLAPIQPGAEIRGVVVSLRDITEVRNLERMRTEFVSNVTHELKTPLTSIKGYVETLLDSRPDPETYRSFLEVISDETERLERLITDTLNLSKLETEHQLSKQEVEIKELITDIKPVLQPRAEEQEVDLEFEFASDLPPLIGDGDKLAQALINLIDNGLKYTSVGGQVEVLIYKQTDQLRIEVEDNGIGIPAEDQSRIFERFYRVDKTRSRRYGGTGLGLSIVKHIISLHQGQIKVESELEVGTKFVVWLPSS